MKNISGFNGKTPEAYFNEFYKQGKSIRKRVAGLLKGCACKTQCLTQQCGCQKKARHVERDATV